MSGYARGAKDFRNRIALVDQQLHDKRAELGIVRALGKPEAQIAMVRASIDVLLELRYTLNVQLALTEAL